MPVCAFLTLENRVPFEIYDHLLHQPFAKAGWQVDEIPWNHPHVNWENYDAVLIRSPWDYQDHPEAFLAVLDSIESAGVPLMNNTRIVRWNMDKRYLKKLRNSGVAIVPTAWYSQVNHVPVQQLAEAWDTHQFIIKPNVGANADDTFRFTLNNWQDKKKFFDSVFKGRIFMLQPFVADVTATGEYSLFYFNNTYSHAILKTPGAGDFRVQEEHGGILQQINPDTILKNMAEHTLDVLPFNPLYARLDFVAHTSPANPFALMEAELIEPSLYFNMNQQAAWRFTKAFIEYVGTL